MESRAYLAYLGHATVFLEIDGVRLLTDPLLRNRVGPLRRQVASPHPDFWQVDAVLISHPHWDHLDPPSLRLLRRDPRVIVPAGAGAFTRRQGMRQVEEIEQGEETTIGDLVVKATPASHSGFRYPFGPSTDSVGFLISASQRIYFAGDTDLFPEMGSLGNDLDVALLPIAGWGLTLGAGHMDPMRAAQSLLHLRPRIAIPIHWGTYYPLGLRWLRPPFLSRPPRDFAVLAADLSPDVDVRILEPGHCLELTRHRVGES